MALVDYILVLVLVCSLYPHVVSLLCPVSVSVIDDTHVLHNVSLSDCDTFCVSAELHYSDVSDACVLQEKFSD